MAEKSRWMRSEFLLISALLLYTLAFAAAYGMRKPAANMQYFMYCKNGRLDRAMYVSFWPLYVCQRAMGGARHNLDRPRYQLSVGP